MLLKAYVTLLQRRRGQDVGQMAVIIAVMAAVAVALGAVFQDQITGLIEGIFDKVGGSFGN